MTTDTPEGSVPRAPGLRLILIATVVAGVIGYVITWLVPRRIGFADYALFAIFWSFLYLLVGALGGIQQEVTRGTHAVPAGEPPRVNRARNFGLASAGIILAGILATSPLWAAIVFPDHGWTLVLPLAVGAAAFVLVAVLAGALSGTSQWRSIAVMIVVDAGLRLTGITVVLAFTHDVVALAWAAAVPFPLSVVIMWPFIRSHLVGRTQLDIGYRRLTRNVTQTIVAAASTGAMVSGFALLLGVTSAGESKQLVGMFILTISLTRAPLIVVVLSLQSYLIISFRSARALGSRVLAIVGVIVGVGLVLSVLGWLLGPAVFTFLFPNEIVPEGWFIAALVLSSVLVGVLCVTAPAVLACSQHFIYSAGWLIAAIVTVIALSLPIDFTQRTVLALLAGPVAGLIVHGAYLIRAGRTSART